MGKPRIAADGSAAATAPAIATASRPSPALAAALAPFPRDQRHVGLAERTARAHDASHYLLIPQAVATARSAAEVAAAFTLAAEHQLPVTLRSGGSSLSGQAQGAGLVIDTRQHWRDIEVLDGGARVRCGPGATVRAVNARLAPYRRQLGPDPASEIACTIGGVVANNSSGMACGIELNAYRTLESLVVVLPSGTVIDTAGPDAAARLAACEPVLVAGLAALRERVLASTDARRRIASQYSMKNTMGYGVNSLVDFAEPLDILAHLMIGSEGTLGFIASATFTTVPVRPLAATALLVFDRLDHATDSLEPLLGAGARTLELMDAASLRVVQPWLDASSPLATLPIERHTALLAEVQAFEESELADGLAALERVLAGLPLATPAAFTRDAAQRAQLWHLRKGLYTAVAGARPAGTTALLEDVVVPVGALTETMNDLGGLLTGHGYADAVTFGHAKDGNLHFMLNPRLDDPRELATYEAFTQGLVDLVLGHGGSLKAEHGTGRIMAPFVERQFGPELYRVMREIKALFDPRGVLNPGVIITDNPREHLDNLKLAAPVDPAVDACVECGYCEPTCPSRDLTTTPRQRIALMRAMQVAPPADRRELERSFAYLGVDTCAADSLCVLACPVHIDTGKVMKAQRAARRGPVVQRAGSLLARHWGGAATVLRAGLSIASVLPAWLLTAATRAVRTVLPKDWIPEVGGDLPGPGTLRSRLSDAAVSAAQSVDSARVGIAATDPAPADPKPSGPALADPVPSGPAQLDAAVTTPAPASPAASSMARAGSPQLPGDTGQVGMPDRVVLFASCIGALFASPTPDGAAGAFVRLARQAGVEVVIPPGIDALCCSTPWVSKGLTAGASQAAERTFEALWKASDHGGIPVVCEAASCAHQLEELGSLLSGAAARNWARMTTIDPLSYAVRHFGELRPRRLASVAVHPTCSTVHLGADAALRELAEWCADEVFVPPSWGCCAFAGDRGLLHPELTAAATAPEAREVLARERALPTGRFDAYVSANRTCEMGISRATARPYEHILELLARLT